MEDKQLTDMYADRKNDVYAARAMEVVDNSGGALERRDFGLAGMLVSDGVHQRLQSSCRSL